nr:hypothetical protein [uncultured Brumimicrobium sp.]
MIVVESGGTKSTWVFHDISGQQKSITTVGLHPQELSDSKLEVISDLIEVEQLQGSSVYFFGAGCESNEAKNKVIRFLEKFSLLVQQVETDIYAACVAHLGDAEGVVGILGTGAVAAHFDGHKIVQQTSGLGYMLGDEGSGFDIGKRLLQSYFRKELPFLIVQEIDAYFEHKPVLHRIYESDGRMFVAGLTKIAHKFRSEIVIQKILNRSFIDFCTTALQPLNLKSKVHMIGSVSYYFEKELNMAFLEAGFQLGNIEKEAVFKVFSYLSNKNNT